MSARMKWDLIGLAVVSLLTGATVGVLCTALRFNIPGPYWLLYITIPLGFSGIYVFARSIRLQFAPWPAR